MAGEKLQKLFEILREVVTCSPGKPLFIPNDHGEVLMFSHCFEIDVEKAYQNKEVITGLLKAWPSDDWDSCIPRLEDDPDYRQLEHVIGDQLSVLKLLALGMVLGIWDLVMKDVEFTEVSIQNPRLS